MYNSADYSKVALHATKLPGKIIVDILLFSSQLGFCAGSTVFIALAALEIKKDF